MLGRLRDGNARKSFEISQQTSCLGADENKTGCHCRPVENHWRKGWVDTVRRRVATTSINGVVKWWGATEPERYFSKAASKFAVFSVLPSSSLLEALEKRHVDQNVVDVKTSAFAISGRLQVCGDLSGIIQSVPRMHTTLVCCKSPHDSSFT